MNDSYLDSNGARLRYRDEGQGPAVLLLHGWTLDLEQWNGQVRALSQRLRIVRLDRRGYGLSSGQPSLDKDVTDVRVLCRHLGIALVALVGMSQGARVAVNFARAFPAMVSCIVLDGPPYLGGIDTGACPADLPYQEYCELARSRGLAAFREAWCQHPLAQLKTKDPAAHASLARMIARYPGLDLTAAGLSLGSPPAPAPVNRPLLVINGEHDLESRRSIGRQLVVDSAQAEFVSIPDAGHLCGLDNPVAYNLALSRFLSRHAT